MFRIPGPKGLTRLLAAVLLASSSLAASAQEYKGPITMVVGYPAGGSADLAARILADKLPPLLGGQPVIVENRAGAGGQIAARYVKDGPSNGSVLFLSNSHTIVTVPLILKAPGFDPVADLKPVGGFAVFEQVLVAHPKTNANSYAELLSYFSNNAAERNIAVPAPGSMPEFAIGRLAQITKLGIQPVAYKGSAPATSDVVGGQLAAAFLPVADVLPYIKSGKLRALAVTNTTPLLPGVASFESLGLSELAEAGPLYIWASAKTSDANIARFNAAISKVSADPEVAKRLTDNGLQILPAQPGAMMQTYLASRAKSQRLMEAVGYQPQ